MSKQFLSRRCGLGQTACRAKTLQATNKAGTTTIETKVQDTPGWVATTQLEGGFAETAPQVCTGKTMPPAFAKAAKDEQEN